MRGDKAEAIRMCNLSDDKVGITALARWLGYDVHMISNTTHPMSDCTIVNLVQHNRENPYGNVYTYETMEDALLGNYRWCYVHLNHGKSSESLVEDGRL